MVLVSLPILTVNVRRWGCKRDGCAICEGYQEVAIDRGIPCNEKEAIEAARGGRGGGTSVKMSGEREGEFCG